MLLIFAILTLVYFLIRLFITDKFKKRKEVNIMKWVALSCYLVLTMALQVADTSKYMVDVCGKANSDKALLYTIIPNVFITVHHVPLLTLRCRI